MNQKSVSRLCDEFYDGTAEKDWPAWAQEAVEILERAAEPVAWMLVDKENGVQSAVAGSEDPGEHESFDRFPLYGHPVGEALPATPDLHAAIMNLPCSVPIGELSRVGKVEAYRAGHRDARHAAAELASALRLALPALGVNASDELDRLRRDGPVMRRGSKGDGSDWMGTMRECLEDAREAARVEAQLGDEARAEVKRLRELLAAHGVETSVAPSQWVDANVSGNPALMQAMKNHAEAAAGVETSDEARLCKACNTWVKPSAPCLPEYQRPGCINAGVMACAEPGEPEPGIELRCCLPRGHEGAHSFVVHPAGGRDEP